MIFALLASAWAGPELTAANGKSLRRSMSSWGGRLGMSLSWVYGARKGVVKQGIATARGIFPIGCVAYIWSAVLETVQTCVVCVVRLE